MSHMDALQNVPTMEEVFKNQVEKTVHLVDEWMSINFFPQLLLGPFRNKVILEAGTETTDPNKYLIASSTDEGLISSDRDHFCKYDIILQRRGPVSYLIVSLLYWTSSIMEGQ